MPTPSTRPRRHLVLSTLVSGALLLAACGGGRPSVRADPVTTTSEPTTTSTSTGPTTTTTTGVATGQVVRYGGLEFTVPADWPVHDLAAEPTTCVRADRHAAYLGEQGESPICPTHPVGSTETLWIAPLTDRYQVNAARASVATTINGLAARVDPYPDLNGALTVVFTEPRLLVVITFGDDRPIAETILTSVQRASD